MPKVATPFPLTEDVAVVFRVAEPPLALKIVVFTLGMNAKEGDPLAVAPVLILILVLLKSVVI